MSTIPYKITGKTAKETAPRKGQTFPLSDRSASDNYNTRGSWSVQPLNLTVAQTTDFVLQASGDSLWFVNTVPITNTDLVMVAFNDDPDYLPLTTGQYIVDFPFYKLRFQWGAQATDIAYFAYTTDPTGNLKVD